MPNVIVDSSGGGSGSGALQVKYAVSTQTLLTGELITGAIVQGATLVAGDRVLLFGQTNSIENRIWVVPTTGALTEPSDFAAGFDAATATARITHGFYAGQQLNQQLGIAVVGTNGLKWATVGASAIGGSAMYYLDPQIQANPPTASSSLTGVAQEHIWWNVAGKTDPVGNISYNPTVGTFSLKPGRYIVSFVANARYATTATYQAGIFNHTTNSFEDVCHHNAQTTLAADQVVAGHRRIRSYAIVEASDLGCEISAGFGGGWGNWAAYWDATAFGLSNAQMARWNSIEIHQISGQLSVSGQAIARSEIPLIGLAGGSPAANVWTDLLPATGITIPPNIAVDIFYQCGMFRNTAGLVNFRLFNITDNTPHPDISTIAFEAAAFSGTTSRISISLSAAATAKTYKLQYRTNNAGTQSLDLTNSTAKLGYIQSGTTATTPYSTQIDTSGSATIAAQGNSNYLIVDPASAIASLSITLPTQFAISDGVPYEIYFGGAIAALETVVFALAVVPPAGMTLVGGLTPIEALSGDSLTYIKSGSAWRRIDT